MQLTDEQYADWMDMQRKNMLELQEIAKQASNTSIMDDVYFIRVAAVEYAASKGYPVLEAINTAESLLTELKNRGY